MSNPKISAPSMVVLALCAASFALCAVGCGSDETVPDPRLVHSMERQRSSMHSGVNPAVAGTPPAPSAGK